MWTLIVVVFALIIAVGLHLVDTVIPLGSAHNAKVLIEQGTMRPLDEAIALRATDLGGAMLNPFELQEQLIRVVVGPPELTMGLETLGSQSNTPV